MSTSTQTGTARTTIAVVGYGGTGATYAASLAEMLQVEQIVVIDPDPAKRRSFLDEYAMRKDCVAYPSVHYLSRHPAAINRGIVTTPPVDHVAMAQFLLAAGADILVEGGRKSLRQMIHVMRAAATLDCTIALPLHQHTANRDVLRWLRLGEGGRVHEEAYTWLSPRWAEPAGPIEDRGPHAIGSALEAVGRWTLPESVRARRLSPALEELKLAWGPEADAATPRSRALLGADPGVPHEALEVKRRTARGLLHSPGRTTLTPADRPYGSEFFDSDLNELAVRFPATEPVEESRIRMLAQFIADPRELPVAGDRVLMVQSVYDAALDSLANGGEPRVPQPITV